MKKLTIFIILILFVCYSYGQWSTSGNDINSGGFFGTLGTANTYNKLNFKTKGNLVGAWDTTGFFGIGTTTPNAKFHLHEATQNVSSTMRISNL